MATAEIHQFLKNLTEVSIFGEYISREDRFFLSTDRNNKNLNTSEIVKISNAYLSIIKADLSLSMKERAQLMGRLGRAIKLYRGRLYESKTWYQKIASSFSILTDEESQLQEIQSKATTYKWQFKEMQSIIKIFSKQIEDILNEPKNQLLYANVKLLEGTSSTNLGFGQIAHCFAMYSYLNDLEAYRKKIEETDNKFILGRIDAMTSELMSAIFISFVQGGGITGGPSFIRKEAQIMARIQSLKENGKNGDFIMLPGGYSVKQGFGHGIILQLVKTDDKSCSVTIIDTNMNFEAIKEFMASQNISLNEIVKPSREIDQEKFSNILKDNRLFRHDKKFESVDFDLFDNDFLENIFKDFSLNQLHPGATFVKDLEKCIRGKNREIIDAKGRRHTTQTRNTCTFKSISCWIHQVLEKDYPPFKLFVTAREIDRLKKLSSDPLHGKEATVLLEKSSQVLKKRSLK